MAKNDHQTNSPEVEHRLEANDNDDANAELREDLKKKHADESDALKARQDREIAMAAPVQKVMDGNETAALKTISGNVPPRDLSDAPPPNPLGPLPEDWQDDKLAKAGKSPVVKKDD